MLEQTVELGLVDEKVVGAFAELDGFSRGGHANQSSQYVRLSSLTS